MLRVVVASTSKVSGAPSTWSMYSRASAPILRGYCAPVDQDPPKPAELDGETDDAILAKLMSRELPHHALENKLTSRQRAVALRRAFIEKGGSSIGTLPYENYNYEEVHGACAENVIGYVPIPVGVAGPLLINGKSVTVPMATTEGCLIASTHRGCKAITMSGGATARVTRDGMTRGPVVQMPDMASAVEVQRWIADPDNLALMQEEFKKTSAYARLTDVKVGVAGRLCFLRFRSRTGDAMGMNMISKGVEKVLGLLTTTFPDMRELSLSGNYCTDKKPSAMNWIEGRGKSVLVEAVIKKDIVKSVLKADVDLLCEINVAKNLIGSAMAGSVGGFNAHASNVVAAVYIACGQDPAQNVESSTCMTLMEKTNEGDLRVSVTMPSIEVGTIGGGTSLSPQASMLNMIGVKERIPGAESGDNARQLAQVVAGAVLAGELSLMSALAAGSLVASHMMHNRKKPGSAPAPEPKKEDEKVHKTHKLPGAYDMND